MKRSAKLLSLLPVFSLLIFFIGTRARRKN